MKRPLLAFLSYIDIFGSQITLTACQKEKFTSGFGGVLTLIALTFTTLFSIRATVDCVTRSEATIASQVINVANPGPLQLNSSNFIFAIGYENNEYPLSSSIFNFQMKYIVRQQQPDGTVTSTTKTVPLVKCTLDYWEGYETEYKMYGLNNYLCPSTTNYILSGVRKGSNFSSFSLEVVSCVNLAYQPDVVCKSPADLATIVPSNTAKISLIYTDNTFNFGEYDSPVTRYVSSYSWNVAPGLLTKQVEIPVTQQTIATDGNLMLTVPPSLNITYRINGAEKIDVSPKVTSGGLDVYMSIQFVKSTQLAVTSRIFAKLDSVFATVGGVGSTLIGILAFVGVAYNEYAMKIQIANTLYEFDLPKGSSQKKASKRCCQRRRRKVEDEKSISSSGSSDKKAPESDTSLIKIVDTAKAPEKSNSDAQIGAVMTAFNNYEKSFGRTLPFSLWEYIKRIYNCGKRKEDLLASEATERMEKEVDLTYILKKLGEVEKLKEVFFDENQREVFSYSRTPKIYLENESDDPSNPQAIQKKADSKQDEKKKKQTAREVNTLRKFAMLFRSYQKLCKQNKDPINQKLLDLVDSEMQDILYELDYQLRTDPALKAAFYQNLSVRAFEEILARKRKNKQSFGLTKQQAAYIIGKRLLNATRSKKNRKRVSPEANKAVDFPADTQQVTEIPNGNNISNLSIQNESVISKQQVLIHHQDKGAL